MRENQKRISSSIPTVSELTRNIKDLLERNFLEVMVEGEVSNAKTSRSGHTYFTLKDEHAQLSCVIWRSVAQRRDIAVEDGKRIIAGGDIEVYPPHGQYQLIVEMVQKAGTGALQKAFEELKKKLKEEGLFDQIHKKSLPRFPRRIGVITSETGAAFHDIRNTLEKRWPIADLLLYHASVQGDNAAPEIVEGIKYFSERNDIDILIVGRGGGSLEDLWAFNEEQVARALFDCPVPTVSAVGHEVDFSISDFVADKRAATPTQAAIIAVPDISELKMSIDELTRRFENRVGNNIKRQNERVQQLIKAHALLVIRRKVESYSDRIQNLIRRLHHQLQLKRMESRDQLQELTYRLKSLDPNEPLERGFTRVLQDDTWIKRRSQLNDNEKLTIQWKDGELQIEGNG